MSYGEGAGRSGRNLIPMLPPGQPAQTNAPPTRFKLNQDPASSSMLNGLTQPAPLETPPATIKAGAAAPSPELFTPSDPFNSGMDMEPMRPMVMSKPNPSSPWGYERNMQEAADAASPDRQWKQFWKGLTENTQSPLSSGGLGDSYAIPQTPFTPAPFQPYKYPY